MGKVYGIHDIEVHPGVDEGNFVKFFNQELAKPYAEIGWKLILLKGDRGQRAGKYAVIFEIVNREERDRMTPGSEESKRLYEEHKELIDNFNKKWDTFSPTDMSVHAEYTDYVELK